MMRAVIYVLAFHMLTLCGTLHANSDIDTESISQMNGIKWRDYDGFWQRDRLVTVRFRLDNEEQRFIYANDIAWQAMKQGANSFPDGAVFTKVGAKTERDPLFDNAAVPSRGARYQVMVKDTTKFPETNGWGYALFSANGKRLTNDEQATTRACHACHVLAASRGYIFAQPVSLGAEDYSAKWVKDADNILFFVTEKIDTYPEIKRHIGRGFNELRVLDHDIRNNLFQGTLDEMTPFLLRELRRAVIPVALVDKSGSKYAVAYQGALAGCPSGSDAITTVIPPLVQVTKCHARKVNVLTKD